MNRGSPGVPITRSVLDWAIRESGFDLDDLSSNVSGGAEVLGKWISGTALPSRAQLEKLAKKLKRPTALFLLPGPPKSKRKPVAFRHPKSVVRSTFNVSERRYLRFAQRLQDQLAWTLADLRTPRAQAPSAKPTDDPEVVGERLHEWVGLAQLNTKQPRDNESAFTLRRELVQERGVVVCVLSIGRESTQAFSLWDEYAPVIVINSTNWNAASRSYSLFHELAHMLLRVDSACIGLGGRVSDYSRDGDLEMWCNRVAAATLMPWNLVCKVMRERLDLRSTAKIRTIELASQLASALRVSLRAMVIRLIQHGAADWDLWDQVPEQSDFPVRQGGGGMNRAQRRLSEVGRRAMSILFEGENRGAISRNTVRDVLRLGDLDVDSIRGVLRQG